jgi:uncharacterized protein (UPF0276 family)
MNDSKQRPLAGDSSRGLPELGVGIVYSSSLEPLIESDPGVFDVVEIEPQTTWLERPDRPGEILARSDVDDYLANLPYPKLVHSIGCPIGGSTPGPADQLSMLRDTVRRLRAPWASEHLAFNQTGEFFTGFFLPPRQTTSGIEQYCVAIERLREALGVPIAIETGVNYLRPRSDEIPDGTFVAELAHRTGCGILLDLHNIYSNECNGRQTMRQFLEQIPMDRVWEVHVAGGFELQGYWLDAHSGAMPDRLFGIARDVIPDLPNLKAIIFEVFSSFLPSFGPDGVRSEMARLRELWALRRPAPGVVGHIGRPRASLPALAGPGVAEWERTLGALAVGRAVDTPLGRELAADAGVRLIGSLIHEFRASMVVAVYRLSCRLMMLALTPEVFRAILEDFWAREPPKQYAASEAEAFIAYLRAQNLRLPQLVKMLEFERAAMDTLMDGQSRVVRFSSDPFPLLRALADGRLPDIIPEQGDYEIELKGEGAVTTPGVDLESVAGAVPFH